MTAKPVVIIDLDGSPFRVLTPSPKAVIVLSDSDTEKDKDRRGGSGGAAGVGGAAGNATAGANLESGAGAAAGTGMSQEKSGAGLLMRSGGAVGSTLGQSLGLMDGPNVMGVGVGAGGATGTASSSTAGVLRKTPPERRSPVDDMFGPKTPPGFPTSSSGSGLGNQQSLKTLQAPKFSMQVKTKSTNLRPVNPLYDPGDLDEGKEDSPERQDDTVAGDSAVDDESGSVSQSQGGLGMGYGAGGSGGGTIATVGPNTPPEPAPQSPSPDVYDPFEPTKSPSPSPTPGGSSRDRSDALSIGRLSDEEQSKTTNRDGSAPGSGADSGMMMLDGGAEPNDTMNGVGPVGSGGGPDTGHSRTPPQSQLMGRSNGNSGKVTVLSNIVLGGSAAANSNAKAGVSERAVNRWTVEIGPVARSARSCRGTTFAQSLRRSGRAS